VFEDGQMYSPQRLVWGFVAAARNAGAVVANHCEATGALREGRRVRGIAARDRLTGERFEIEGSTVINASGPWAEGLLESAGVNPKLYSGTYSRDTCFVIDRRYPGPMALAVQGQSLDSDALIGRGARHMFMVPWRDKTLVGVWHRVVPRRPDDVGLEEAELQSFIDEMNAILPPLRLGLDDVRMAAFGLVPFGEHQQGGATLSFGHESKILDHEERDGISGMISVISVRYTVARKDAAIAVDLACKRAGLPVRPLDTTLQPLPGGDFDDFGALLGEAQRSGPEWLGQGGMEALVRNYGTDHRRILDLAAREPALAARVDGTQVSLAEVAYACRQEMAVTLGDVLFRRTDIATGEAPSRSAITQVCDLMQREHQWSGERRARELDWVAAHLHRYWADRKGALS
jgi:glycerol-3-phosphate dehydrogenase